MRKAILFLVAYNLLVWAYWAVQQFFIHLIKTPIRVS